MPISKKKIQVSKDVLALLQGAQFVAQAPVYKEEKTLVTIPSGDYEVSSREIAATATNKAWTCHEATFYANGQPFTLRYRSGITPDEDMDLTISTFVALRNWPSDTDVRIPKGKSAIFAING
jgi:hypothetical protein